MLVNWCTVRPSDVLVFLAIRTRDDEDSSRHGRAGDSSDHRHLSWALDGNWAEAGPMAVHIPAQRLPTLLYKASLAAPKSQALQPQRYASLILLTTVNNKCTRNNRVRLYTVDHYKNTKTNTKNKP